MASKTLLATITLPILFGLTQSSCVTTQSGSSTPNSGFLTSYSGYKKASSTNDRLIYHNNLDKVNSYNKIYLEKVVVMQPSDMAEKKITAEDISNLQQLFKTSLEEEIISSRLALATGPGPDTLSLRAAIVDIQPGDPKMFLASSAPYVGAATTVLGATTGAKFGSGSAKIEIELIDSESRDRFAGMIDNKAGNKLEIVQGMSRWGHVELAVKKWVKRFGELLADPASFSA